MFTAAGCLLHPAPQALLSHVAIPYLVKEGGRKKIEKKRKETTGTNKKVAQEADQQSNGSEN